MRIRGSVPPQKGFTTHKSVLKIRFFSKRKMRPFLFVFHTNEVYMKSLFKATLLCVYVKAPAGSVSFARVN